MKILSSIKKQKLCDLFSNKIFSVGINLGHDAGISVIGSALTQIVEFEKLTGIKHICGGHEQTTKLFQKYNFVNYFNSDAEIPLGICDYISDRNFCTFEISHEANSVHWECTGKLEYDKLVKRIEIHNQQTFLPKSKNTFLVRHHWAHANISYLTSGFREALILVLDGVGNFSDCGLLAYGKNHNIEPVSLLSNINGPRFGLLYESLSKAIFGNQFDTGKLLGLASFGVPIDLICSIFRILLIPNRNRKKNSNLFEFIEESYLLNTSVLIDDTWYKYDPLTGGYLEGHCKTYGDYTNYFGSKFPLAVSIGDNIVSFEFSYDKEKCKNLAATLQYVYEKDLLYFVQGLKAIYKETDNLCLGGGCALNISANTLLKLKSGFANIYIPSCCDDSGISTGCALAVDECARKEIFSTNNCTNHLTYSGLESIMESKSTFLDFLNINDLRYSEINDHEVLIELISNLLNEGRTVGLVLGRSETGPRALGRRSILANPFITGMKNKVSVNIKRRESFRPLAISCVLDDASRFFEGPIENCSTMLFSVKVKREYISLFNDFVHVDNTVRLQTVEPGDNKILYNLLKKIGEKNPAPILLNTSLNVGGKAMQNSFEENIRVLLDTPLDYLCFTDFEMLITKSDNSI